MAYLIFLSASLAPHWTEVLWAIKLQDKYIFKQGGIVGNREVQSFEQRETCSFVLCRAEWAAAVK